MTLIDIRTQSVKATFMEKQVKGQNKLRGTSLNLLMRYEIKRAAGSPAGQAAEQHISSNSGLTSQSSGLNY